MVRPTVEHAQCVLKICKLKMGCVPSNGTYYLFNVHDSKSVGEMKLRDTYRGACGGRMYVLIMNIQCNYCRTRIFLKLYVTYKVTLTLERLIINVNR